MATFQDLEKLEKSDLHTVNTVLIHNYGGVQYVFKKVNKMMDGETLIHEAGIMCYSSDQDLSHYYSSAREAFFNDFIDLGMITLSDIKAEPEPKKGPLTLKEILEREFKEEHFTHFSVMTWHYEGNLEQWKKDFQDMIKNGELIEVEQKRLGKIYKLHFKNNTNTQG